MLPLAEDTSERPLIPFYSDTLLLLSSRTNWDSCEYI